MKIKVSKETQEFEGSIEEKIVKPFGTSAHITVSKKHTGKIMKLIEPTDTEYKWVLPITILEKIKKDCEYIISKGSGKHAHYEREIVERLNERFTIDDLEYVIEILENQTGNTKTINLLKKTYNL